MFILTRFKMCQDVEKVPIIKKPDLGTGTTHFTIFPISDRQ